MDKINLKIDIIMEYINDHNINDKIIDPNNYNTKYTVHTMFVHCFVYEHFCTSYNAYEQLNKFFNPISKHPSRSRINKFTRKISKMCISEKAFNYHNKKHGNKYTNDDYENNKNLLLDSSFLPNSLMPKNSDCIGINAFYKSKYGTKLSILSDVKGNPIVINISSGNKNDAKIAYEWLESFTNDSKAILNNKQLLGDSGYDSEKLKSKLTDLNCRYIIPKNIRNKSSIEYTSQKEKVIKKAKEEKKLLWEKNRFINTKQSKEKYNKNELKQQKIEIRKNIKGIEKNK
jgi:hypothetical protein